MNEYFLCRGKRCDNGEWIVGHPISGGILRDGVAVICPYVATGEIGGESKKDGVTIGPFFYVDKATVGRCTGLRDKNGTLIFEGDVIRLDGQQHEVKYRPKYAAFVLSELEYGLVLAWERCDEMEVVGNVHDNPELTV